MTNLQTQTKTFDNLRNKIEVELLKELNKDLLKIYDIKNINEFVYQENDYSLVHIYNENMTNLQKEKVKNNLLDIEKVKNIIIKKLQKKHEKNLAEKLDLLTKIENAKDFNGAKITIEWKRSSMWGNNPTAKCYIYGIGTISSGSIGGCGYDKESTAVAKSLNNSLSFRKLLCEFKNMSKNIDVCNREAFGYGVSYGYTGALIPYFDGGVGCSCYEKIFEKLGYKMQKIACGKTFDVYTIEKEV